MLKVVLEDTDKGVYREIEWTMDTPMPIIGPAVLKVKQVEADGAELSYIRTAFHGLRDRSVPRDPLKYIYPAMANVVRWYGEDAWFIVGNLNST